MTQGIQGGPRDELFVLDRSHTIAKPGFSRWMVPPAALCVHLCIGQAYAFSVFNLPMTKLIGITQSAPDDWKLTELGWIFSHRHLLPRRLVGRVRPLGRGRRPAPRDVHRRAVLGRRLLHLRASASTSTISGSSISATACSAASALGIGYISPVSTLIKWFPDRPGMATGMAIMGFGGGAFIASPLSVWLMSKFTTADPCRRRRDLHRARRRLLLLHDGRRDHRARAGAGLEARGLHRRRCSRSKLITTNDVFVYDALKTPQFWLIWWVLCLNVTAGIGVLGQASAMSQEMFPGHITPVAAAGFVGLMSLFNMGGRFFWASTSDYIGRKNTYFMLHGARLRCCTAPCPTPARSAASRCSCCASCVIISMYGGGFATVPAYLADMFGTRYVGAIHGLLLTAWSMAGIFGPVLVNYIREYNVTHGVPKAQAYNTTMYIMAGLLVIGFICNSSSRPCTTASTCIRSTRPRKRRSRSASPANRPAHKGETDMANSNQQGTTTLQLVLAWGFVGIPLTLGVLQTLINSMKLFQ